MAETGPTAEQHLFVVRTFLAKADRDRDFQSRAIDAFEVFVRALQQENETLRKRIRGRVPARLERWAGVRTRATR
jgi:hypothetical protein